MTGAFGELFFSALLVVGIGGRVGPLGLFAVNLMAVISYRQVLLAEGYEAALAQHILWGFMLIMLAVYGLGALALDHLLVNRFGQKQRW
jgi:putative oxidoreductase